MRCIHVTLVLWLATGLLAGLFAGCGDQSAAPKATGAAGAGATSSSAVQKTATMADTSKFVFPTSETIESGQYAPLSRPLFLYVNKASLAKPHVAEYLRYCFSDGQALVSEVGYIKLNASRLKTSVDRLERALGNAKLASKLAGTVNIDGSSTVFPISQAVAEEFGKKHKAVRVVVGTSGTGGGFKRFVAGEIDISDASRPIAAKEIEQCKKQNIEYVELEIAIDGLSVVVNAANDWCVGMTVDQLKSIWEPDSKVKRWSDIDPNWPNQPIKLYGPGTDSGTFDYFTEVVVGKAKASRADFTPSEDDNVLVRGVEGDKYSLGYFGYAYYLENKDKLKALGIAPLSAKH